MTRWKAVAAVLLSLAVASLVLNAYQYSSPRSVTVTTSFTKTTTVVPTINSSSLACSGVAGQFLQEGLYSPFGYPKIGYNGYTSLEPYKSNYTYWISRPDGALFYLGAMQTPLMNVCESLGLAVSALDLNPSNYTLAALFYDAGWIIDGKMVSRPAWTFFFARVYQGFWLDATVGNTTDNGGYSAAIDVDALNGTTETASFDLSSLPASGQNYSLTLNASQALQILRQSNESNIPRSLLLGGTVSSIFPRIVLLGNPSENSSYFGPLTNASLTGQKRLCWIIDLNSSGYQGFFAVDAGTGQILVAQAAPNGPPSPPPGAKFVYVSGPIAKIDYQGAGGVTVAWQSFQVNGSTLGIKGAFSVTVPNVMVVLPGSSGSVNVSVKDECPQGYICPSNTTLSAGPLPSGLSINFFQPELRLAANETVQDSMQISASQNATQGTYLIELKGLAVPVYFVLSVWNSQGAWPVLPMLVAESDYIVLPNQ
jgi:hypothetical protein